MSCCDNGFRLAAPSECSLRSKARIDALFEDSRSICSSSFTIGGAGGGWSSARTAVATPGSIVDEEDACCGDEDQQRRVNSAVQARIEAMFASVEAESGTAPGECAAAVLPVKYMGAAPVGGRVASVRGLQEPLRQLVERINESVNAKLEVSRRGLTFRTSELHEKNNPFRRIAVWSALKLQARQRLNSLNSQDLLHAFVPLVADDRGLGSSNATVITNSTINEDRHADLYRTMRGLSKDASEYPPIFAVVMRRPGAARLLECHAFACLCEEDAIAAAATLYRALLADLDATARRPRQKNGLGCASLASVASSIREASPASRRRSAEFSARKETNKLTERLAPTPTPLVTANQPVRPPRVKKSSMSSGPNTEDERSSSTPRKNVSVADKPSWRKKKNSDIKAEDVLEARSRRLRSPFEESNVKASSCNIVTRHADNSSSSTSSNLGQSSEERRMNAKNKIYSSRGSQCKAVSDEVQVIDNIYNERKPNSEIVEVRTEKSSSERERSSSSSYDFECCMENSLYESGRIYAKACLDGSKSKSEQRIYEVTRSSTTAPTRTNEDSIDAKQQQQQQQQRRRSIAGSDNTGGFNTAARHRDHFRDADKIYSLDLQQQQQQKQNDEVYARGLNSRSSSLVNRHEDRIYDIMRTDRQSPRKTRKGENSEDSARSSKRHTPVSTMDRPIRRPTPVAFGSPEPIKKQPAASRRSQHQHHNQQQESCQRRRNRAGSEPPISRTEVAAQLAAATSAAALLKRSQSDLDLDRGDPLTRVELPRRGSFLKPGSVRKRDGIEGGGAGTPLGFTELFDEFRNQEGLTSVDDILAAIIDPEGMSFNELKPLYKEFLLKLAATLTQDELYQRSASIMRRRRRLPQRRRSSRAGSNGRPCLLRRAIKRSVSRLRSASTAPTEFTSVIFPARRLNERSSFGSSSSCEAKKYGPAAPTNGHHHRGNRVLASKLGRRRSTRCSSSKSRNLGHTTSEDSDTCRRMGTSRGLAAAANRSSSGYVSCSECSYDSESCTCVSADKCYCSLSRGNKSPSNDVPSEVPQPAPMVCSCDTDSCSESNKCYCARRTMPSVTTSYSHPSILEQLRQKGIVPSESTLSRGTSPDKNKVGTRPVKNLASSKSLEYLKVRSSSVRGSADNLALDYDLFRPGCGRRSSQCSSGSEKVLVVSARDPQGRLIYVGGGVEHDNGRRSSRRCPGGGRHRRNVEPGHHEALSIKKSAEIAAVFGHGQRTGIGRKISNASSLRSSVSLEAGLGYLP